MNDDREFLKKKAWIILLLEMGMSYDVIERVLEISPSTVINYIKKVQLTSEWKGKIIFSPDAKPTMLKVYADITYGEKTMVYDADFTKKLTSVLAELLEEQKILQILSFALPAIQGFAELKYTEDVPMGYRNLLEKLMIWIPFQSLGWSWYLYQIASGKISPPQPKEFFWGNNHYLHKVIQLSADETRRFAAPILTKKICEYIDNKIAEYLYGNSGTVITLFFGLDGKAPQTIEQIGLELDITPKRIKQIKERAISRLKKVKPSIKPIGDAWDFITSLKQAHSEALLQQKNEYIQKLYNLEHLEEQIIEKIEDSAVINAFDTLIMKVIDLDLSVRILNCLKCADEEIVYVWQWVQLSREYFLKFRNFGKKSLIELDEFVREKNLHFNWKFSDVERAHLELETTKKVK
ncbi:MAG: hypothetical protein NTX91_01370 [candidate division SR1 bacterium]|nr:hypothetical protein [candidate division SR1 bacterium]